MHFHPLRDCWLLAAADVCCLLYDGHNTISQNQEPTRLHYYMVGYKLYIIRAPRSRAGGRRSLSKRPNFTDGECAASKMPATTTTEKLCSPLTDSRKQEKCMVIKNQIGLNLNGLNDVYI